MGIGNSGPVMLAIPSSAPHYPSWGSETRQREPRSPRPRYSLPLMGIGNEFVPTADYGVTEILITPHGDRKRSSPFVFLIQTACEI